MIDCENTPIIIPCYDRPEFLTECLESLYKCHNIEKFPIIFSYDTKSMSSTEGHRIIDLIVNCPLLNKTIIHRKDIWHGSLNSTGSIGFITNEFNYENGGFIYIEEDVVVSKCFLDFCIDALNEYEENKNVMMITGLTLEESKKEIPNEAELNMLYSCSATVGIASWWNRWQWVNDNMEKYCHDPNFIIKDLEPARRKGIKCHMDGNGAMINKAGGGLVNASMLINEQVCLLPDIALANHIGWHGWHMPKQTAIEGENVAFANTFHEENTYSKNFIKVEKKDALRTFGL